MACGLQLRFADETCQRLGHDAADNIGDVWQVAELERSRVRVERHR
jgi:hypothetical protein